VSTQTMRAVLVIHGSTSGRLLVGTGGRGSRWAHSRRSATSDAMARRPDDESRERFVNKCMRRLEDVPLTLLLRANHAAARLPPENGQGLRRSIRPEHATEWPPRPTPANRRWRICSVARFRRAGP
jgi:hypothetical protein